MTAFPDLSIPLRSNKPRTTGVTMMIDWGLPVGHQTDVVDTAGAYIDMAKIAGSISALMPEHTLKEKIRAYRDADIDTSPGGLLAEYAYLKGNLHPFFRNAIELGFSAVEISDNLINWDLATKRETIQIAINEYGLNVLGEVGRKDEAMSNDSVLRDIETCFEAGVSSVYVEAQELFGGEHIRSDLINSIVEEFSGLKIIYELPVVLLPGSSREFKHRVANWMVSEFGPEVNLANVEWDEVWVTEMIRRRMADNLEV
ncbi:MAG: phosphosulfolactate synthase [Pseudomonadota bacterium]